MPDDPNQAAEPAETAQGAIESETTAPPWGDDFTPERAWNTLQKQRESEKELKERLRQEQQVWEDEQALRERLEAKGFEFAEDAEDEDDDALDDDQPQFLTKQEYEEREQRRIAGESARMFASDLKELTSERPLSKLGKDWVQAQYDRGQFKSADDVQTALQEWYAYEDSLKEDGKRARPKSPTPPSTPGAGKAGEQEFDRRGASAAQRKAHREARIAAAVEAANE